MQFIIFSTRYNSIASHINSELHGVHRCWKVRAGTHTAPEGVDHLARKRIGAPIFRLVKRIDENAFISQSNVVGVYGKGFDQMK